MSIWALSDFHLSFGTPNKSMEVFGSNWQQWTQKIHQSCSSLIQPEDLLLIPGDISWAHTLEQVLPDLEWIAKLPGTKLLLKGNHDYWWPSKAKLSAILPPSVYFIQHDCFHWKDISIGGARLWDSSEFSFSTLSSSESPPSSPQDLLSDEKIFERELLRLQMSLDLLAPKSTYRIAMTHYPPIGLDLKPSKASALLEAYHIDHCVFGHLHNLNTKEPLFGKKGKTHYHLTSCDYLDFTPLKIL
jgi:predicted phosphohydrolase